MGTCASVTAASAAVAAAGRPCLPNLWTAAASAPICNDNPREHCRDPRCLDIYSGVIERTPGPVRRYNAISTSVDSIITKDKKSDKEEIRVYLSEHRRETDGR